MKSSLTLTISLDDIKKSIDTRFTTDGTDVEYESLLFYDTGKALDELLEQIKDKIKRFAKTEWDLPEEN